MNGWVKNPQYFKPKLHLVLWSKGLFKLCFEEKTMFWAKQNRFYKRVSLLNTFKYNSILSPISSFELEIKRGSKKLRI
ncbi:MAG: Unknown protein [uncultured Sulfurovum sp.]|uniref:Uncharacterized protein n=1 Tax=uncultured Sulfurovum sp. TaxID=269237 RepID=A0A6S6TZ39_9BACT|nr:MAG: Unknown protein [uncultured Sulfurovum sp.]